MLTGIVRYLSMVMMTLPVQAQLLTDVDVYAENFLFRIKNIEFFIDRFNGQDPMAPLQKPAASDTLAYTQWVQQRNELMVSLFDHVRIQKKEYDLKQLREFIADVNAPARQRELHFSDSLWYAVLEVNVVHKGQPAVLWCVLQPQRDRYGVSTWNLKQMHCPALGKPERFKSIQFAPNVHGTDFMAVKLSLKDTAWIGKQQSAEASHSRILDNLARQTTQVKEISSIRYHFLQCKPWAFSVRYVNRQSKNSGWLMDTFTSHVPEDYLLKNHLE